MTRQTRYVIAEIAETARKAYAPIDAGFLKSISRANVPGFDYTSAFKDIVPKIDLSALAPTIELPPISEELQQTLDQAYKGISENVAVLPGVEAVLQSAKELSKQYAGLLPFPGENLCRIPQASTTSFSPFTPG